MPSHYRFIAFKEFTLQTGDEILLKTRPVDPRDLFRGDYVILRYDISTINTDTLTYQSSDFKENDKVYVLLNVDDKKIGTLSNIDKNKPTEGVFIEGTVKSASSNRVNIEYGIESYFVPEGKGKEIERNLGKIYTKIAVDDFGNAVIKSLILDEKDIDLN
ncbi:MAG: GDYXXLXY domain-containing protein [Deltaproteobacteria bacterium]|nr:GDYXXLXY domain-containing protein [Deltaproteobacteria bacterium]